MQQGLEVRRQPGPVDRVAPFSDEGEASWGSAPPRRLRRRDRLRRAGAARLLIAQGVGPTEIVVPHPPPSRELLADAMVESPRPSRSCNQASDLAVAGVERAPGWRECVMVCRYSWLDHLVSDDKHREPNHHRGRRFGTRPLLRRSRLPLRRVVRIPPRHCPRRRARRAGDRLLDARRGRVRRVVASVAARRSEAAAG
jgi:hypothetical protein